MMQNTTKQIQNADEDRRRSGEIELSLGDLVTYSVPGTQPKYSV